MIIIPVTRPPLVGFTDKTIEKYVLASRNTHLNLSDFTVFTQAEWQSDLPKRLIVPAGVTIQAESSAFNALTDGTATRGGTLEFKIDGAVRGGHGPGGGANSGAGSPGSAALAVSSNCELTGSGTLSGGGGGGGGGGVGGNGVYTGQDGPVYQNAAPQYYFEWWNNAAGWLTYVYWGGVLVANGIGGQLPSYSLNGYTYYPYQLQAQNNVGQFPQYQLYSIYRQYPVATSGGAGGAGGVGQDWITTPGTGAAGSAGGTNAGTGGHGGAGGAYGSPGVTGNTGGSGNNGAGAAGGAGGAAGRSISLNGHTVTRTKFTGTLLGPVS